MESSKNSVTGVSRRSFLIFTGACAIAASPVVPALARSPRRPERSLSFKNTHTGDVLDVVYYAGGRYQRKALSAINLILRDWRTNEVTRMDPRVLDILHDIRRIMATNAPIEIISGYRSPATNHRLASAGRGVARNSFHMRGMAVDFRLPGRDVYQLARVAKRLRKGGVGYYRRSGFIHVDSGRPRSWGI